MSNMKLKNSLKVFHFVCRDRFGLKFSNVLLTFFLYTLFLIFALFFYNIDHYLKKTSSSLVFYTFLKTPLTLEKIDKIKKLISNWPEVAYVKTISPEEGLELLKKSLGKERSILNTLETNPLPFTLEIGIKPTFTETENLRQITEKLKKYEEIDWFDSTERYLSPLLRLKRYAFIAFALGTIAVIFLTILIIRTSARTFFFKYKANLELLEFLGASKFFIFFPFLFEGFIESLFSAILSSLFTFYTTSLAIATIKELNITVIPLPLYWYIVFICLITFFGTIGGLFLKIEDHEV